MPKKHMKPILLWPVANAKRKYQKKTICAV